MREQAALLLQDTLTVAAVCAGAKRPESMRKPRVGALTLSTTGGVIGDAHSGLGPRQVSLIAADVLDALHQQFSAIDAGAMGENLVLAGAVSHALRIGARLQFASGAIIELTMVRKPCVDLEREANGLLRAAVGRSGFFACVLQGGVIRESDTCTLIDGAALPRERPPAGTRGQDERMPRATRAR